MQCKKPETAEMEALEETSKNREGRTERIQKMHSRKDYKKNEKAEREGWGQTR